MRSGPRLSLLRIRNGTFYRQHPSQKQDTTNPEIFRNLNFRIPSCIPVPEHWAILGVDSSGKTTLLQILQGQHFCFPLTARSFPYLSSSTTVLRDPRLRDPRRAIQYIGFDNDGKSSGPIARGAYLSARYESRREDTDFSVLQYLQGKTSLNALEEHQGKDTSDKRLEKVVRDLNLDTLVHMPMGNLSNGQRRRARVGKALLNEPEVLLLDEPLSGLDPRSMTALSIVLGQLAASQSPRVILALRAQDPIPEWITHVLYIGSNLQIAFQGLKGEVLQQIKDRVYGDPEASSYIPSFSLNEIGRSLTASGITRSTIKDARVIKHNRSVWDNDKIGPTDQQSEEGEPLIEMDGVRVEYGAKMIFGTQERGSDGLQWTVRRGDRWGIFGPNGSGKTTLLSLITSDHPQAYSLPIKVFGRNRLPSPGQPGISLFDLQSRIGHSSPEIHAFFPRHLTVRQTIENAWAVTFLGRPALRHERDLLVNGCLRWFRPELDLTSTLTLSQKSSWLSSIFLTPSYNNAPARRCIEKYLSINVDWADEILFGDLPLHAQRVALFLRAIIKKPDLVILDEAFSDMGDAMRDKCLFFLEHGETAWLRPYLYHGRFPSRRSGATEIGRHSHEPFTTGLEPRQALLAVSHVREEVPPVVKRWLRLPEMGSGELPTFGTVDRHLRNDIVAWDKIWGMHKSISSKPRYRAS